MSNIPLVDPSFAGALTDASQRAAAADLTARPAHTPEQVRALAVQFESILLAQMLKDLRDSMFDNDEESSGLGAGPLGDTLFQEFSLALSRAGGIGLAQSMMAPLEAAAGVAAEGPTFVTASPGAIANAVVNAPAALDRPSPLTSPFGWRRDPVSGAMKFHKGVDLAMPVGDDVPAARAGDVISAGELAGYGNTVVIRHDDTTFTRYAHLSEVLVKPGDVVAAGQTIARSGATGKATGPHLHFEVLRDGRSVDPYGVW
jgi:murein DD-endopeptidase MepM/ murein hydrolase activator NlpD